MNDVIDKAVHIGIFVCHRYGDNKKGIKEAIRFILENILVEREFEHPDEVFDYIKDLLNEVL